MDCGRRSRSYRTKGIFSLRGWLGPDADMQMVKRTRSSLPVSLLDFQRPQKPIEASR